MHRSDEMIAANERVLELKRRRGAARLDNLPFDEATLAAAECEVSALEEAAAEAVRRKARRDDERWMDRFRELCVTLRKQEQKRLIAVGNAEAASRKLVKSLNTALSNAAEMRDTIRQMDMPVPLVLAGGALTDRMSQRLAAVLSRLDGHPVRFAQVSWRPSWRAVDENWSVAEETEVGEDLSALTGAHRRRETEDERA